MDTKRISNDMEKILNRQVTNEAANAELYLSFGSWADDQGYSGISNLLFRHSKEEREHMMKFMEYIMSRDGKVDITAIPEPMEDPDHLQDCFEKIFKSEVKNSEAIYKIVDLAMDEKDWASWNFSQWFVKEQMEEENLAMDWLDKLKIAGGAGATEESLYSLDRDLGESDDEAELAREANIEDK